jgi:hypothetical protein
MEHYTTMQKGVR